MTARYLTDGDDYDGAAAADAVLYRQQAADGGFGSGGGAVISFAAVVTDIRLESRTVNVVRWQMALDRTEFRAGDLGVLEAVARSGTRLMVPVLGVVVDAAGDVWHVVEKPLAAGTAVKGSVGGVA